MLSVLALQVGMTKTDAAVQTLSDINPDVVLEASINSICGLRLIALIKLYWDQTSSTV